MQGGAYFECVIISQLPSLLKAQSMRPGTCLVDNHLLPKDSGAVITTSVRLQTYTFGVAPAQRRTIPLDAGPSHHMEGTLGRTDVGVSESRGGGQRLPVEQGSITPLEQWRPVDSRFADPSHPARDRGYGAGCRREVILPLKNRASGEIIRSQSVLMFYVEAKARGMCCIDVHAHKEGAL